ncbi:lysozyme inhibitor LprI family protein [Neobacillus niacini]|uniref:lysozyme inhibitor LprI family protein n=1 Tax=Neobacillus niacini TaxID=86668 RepID=UPI002FFE4789
MKNKQIFFMVLFTIAFVLLAACGNPTNKDIAASATNEDSVENKAPDSDDNSTNSNDKESSKFNNTDTEVTESKKEEYLQKLNSTKKATEELEASDSSTYALKKVENDRWEMWDELLNEVYGVLKEQFTTEEMDQLRKEQRNWIKYRDDTALEASLKYKGGTEEHLEYVAVLANLTEERCHELVGNYMK